MFSFVVLQFETSALVIIIGKLASVAALQASSFSQLGPLKKCTMRKIAKAVNKMA